MPRRRRVGGCGLTFCLLAAGCCVSQLAFGRPWIARRAQVARAARTPGNQPTKEPEFPEFAPSGDFSVETPLFKLERYKKEEGLGLAAVGGFFVVLSVIVGFVVSSMRPQVNLLEQQPSQPQASSPTLNKNKEGKPIRTVVLSGRSDEPSL